MAQIRSDFYKGMDISFLPQYLDEGMVMHDFDGSTIEPFALLKKYGVNSIRLRIWHTPSNVPESKGYCSLEQTIALAKKIVENEMMFMLDFHYSDFWADPGQQNKPKAWKDLTFEELKKAVYDYTREVLLTMKKEGVLPGAVQIGNEIRSGLLFPDGELPNYAQMVELVNAGIDAARSVAGPEQMQVMIHLDQGGRYFYLKEWFEKAFENGLKDFDLIGLSYYPFWHGTFTDLKNTMERLIADYHKPIMVVETAHAWRKSAHGFIDEAQEKIAGFPATPKGQRQVLELVSNIVASIPDHMGQGFYYWEPICLPAGEGWAENMGLLTENGSIMEGIHAFEFTREQIRKNEVAKIYDLPELVVKKGEAVALPAVASVLLFDGSMKECEILWNDLKMTEMSFEKIGSHEIAGTVKNFDLSVVQKINVVEEYLSQENLLSNTNWESGLASWKIGCSDDKVIYQMFPEFVDPFPAPPVNAIRVEGSKNFAFTISQEVSISSKGEYQLEVEMQGTDTTGVDVRLFAKQSENRKELIIHPTEHGYETYRIEKIQLQPGMTTIGVEIKASPMYGMVRRFKLVKNI